MSLRGIGLLAADTSRTRAYLWALAAADLLPAHVIYLTCRGAGGDELPWVPYFDNCTPALRTIEALGVPLHVVDTAQVNSPTVVEAVRSSAAEVLIYSGPGGAILGPELLCSGKRFLHVHAGLLPRFRGSTTIYYSLLLTGRCAATALFLNDEIDGGPVLASREYPPPEDRTTIDHGYDPYMRADLLVRVLREYLERGAFCPQAQTGQGAETYFIVHPVLRHLTILSRKRSESGPAHGPALSRSVTRC